MASGANPVVSIVTPCHNVSQWLGKTAQAVFAQTFEDFEWILVDDGSTDATPDVIRTLERTDARVRAVFLGQNVGVVAARNAGLEVATGRWIALLDGDDVWTATALEHRLSVADLHRDAVVIATDFAHFIDDVPNGAKGHVAQGPRARQLFGSCFQSGQAMALPSAFLPVATLHFAWIGATLAKRDAIEAVGRFDPAFIGPEDTLLWLKLARHGEFVFSPEVTAFYRQRAGSIVSQWSGPKELHYLKVLRYLLELGLNQTERRAVRGLMLECERVCAYAAQKRADHRASLRHAARVLSLAPFDATSFRLAASCLAQLVMRRSQPRQVAG